MSKKYRRNHYIPKFYLQHFCAEYSSFYVFDKSHEYSKNSIRKVSPSQICFEWDRNIMQLANEAQNTVLERETYGYFDNNHAKTFKLLNETLFEESPWTLRTVGDLEMFVPLLYWRSPISDKRFDFKIKNAKTLKEFGIGLKDKNTNQWVDNSSIEKEMITDVNIHKGLRPILASSTFNNPQSKNNDLEWRILINRTKTPYITCDNPLLFKKLPEDFDDFTGSVIFPIGNTRSLIRINEKHKESYPKRIYQDLSLIDQAIKYVICSDYQYLEEILKVYYEMCNKSNELENIKAELFNI